MTNEKELREEIRTRLTYATNEDIYDDLERMCNSIVDLLHSHTKDVVEKIKGMRRPEEKTLLPIKTQEGRDNYFYNLAISDLLASLEDNK